jgi:hypothetical protein
MKRKREQIFIVIAVPKALHSSPEKTEDEGDGGKEITFQNSTNFCAA